MNSKNKNEWYTAFELAGAGGLPNKPTNVSRKATKENWKKRQVKGKKGIAFEYHYSSLPLNVQKQLGFETVNEKSNTLPFILGAAAIATPTSATSSKLKQADTAQAMELLQQAITLLNKASQIEQVENNGIKLNNIEIELIKNYRRCSDEVKVAISTTARSMARKKEDDSELLENSKIA